MLPYADVQYWAGARVGEEPEEDPTPGPSDVPDGTGTEEYGSGPLARLLWTNGDASASTQIGQSIGWWITPDTIYDTVAPGITAEDTNSTSFCFWWVRHIRNDQVTAWVPIDSISCGPST